MQFFPESLRNAVSEPVRSSSQPDPAPPGRCSAAALLLNLPFPLSGSAANGRQCGLKVGPPPAATTCMRAPLFDEKASRGEPLQLVVQPAGPLRA